MNVSVILVGALTVIMMVFLIINSFHALLLMASVPDLWAHWQLADDEYFHALVGAEALPPITVIGVVQKSHADPMSFARMLLDLDYPRFEIILVSDGNDGDTMSELIAGLELYEVPPAFTISLRTEPVRAYYRSRIHPRLLCLDKGGESIGDALNAAVNAARYPHTVAAAPNVIFERDALLRLSRPLLLDRSAACVGTVLRPANGAYLQNGRMHPGNFPGWLLACQTVEYLRSFLFQRLGWNRVASNIVFPGNTVLFKREHILGLGGFDILEERPGIDLAVRLPKFLTDEGIDASMPVIMDPVAWSMLPTSLHAVGQARQRWLRNLRHALSANASLFGNPEYGAFGMVAVPYYWLAIIVAPILEILGYVGLVAGIATGLIGFSFVWAYLAAVVGYGILLSVWTVVFQAISFPRDHSARDVFRLLVFAVVESIGYRQIMMLYRCAAFFVDRQSEHNNGQSPPAGAA
ncbi:MAG: hypothetical protein M3Z30_11550 [Gemmatimonadota bacterium]|nr:hypothetical protein [Gemmatimonadota bacterium]